MSNNYKNIIDSFENLFKGNGKEFIENTLKEFGQQNFAFIEKYNESYYDYKFVCNHNTNQYERERELKYRTQTRIVWR